MVGFNHGIGLSSWLEGRKGDEMSRRYCWRVRERRVEDNKEE